MTEESDRELAVKVHGLYRLGRHWFPALTERLANVVLDLDAVSAPMDMVSHQAGSPRALQDLLTLRDDLHTFVLMSMESMAATGEALVAIADDYLATDEGVRAAFAEQREADPFTPRTTNDGSQLPRPGQGTARGRGSQAI